MFKKRKDKQKEKQKYMLEDEVIVSSSDIVNVINTETKDKKITREKNISEVIEKKKTIKKKKKEEKPQKEDKTVPSSIADFFSANNQRKEEKTDNKSENWISWADSPEQDGKVEKEIPKKKKSRRKKEKELIEEKEIIIQKPEEDIEHEDIQEPKPQGSKDLSAFFNANKKQTKKLRKKKLSKKEKRKLKRKKKNLPIKDQKVFRFRKKKYSKVEDFITYLNEHFLEADEIAQEVFDDENFFGWISKKSGIFDVSLKEFKEIRAKIE